MKVRREESNVQKVRKGNALATGGGDSNRTRANRLAEAVATIAELVERIGGDTELAEVVATSLRKRRQESDRSTSQRKQESFEEYSIP